MSSCIHKDGCSPACGLTRPAQKTQPKHEVMVHGAGLSCIFLEKNGKARHNRPSMTNTLSLVKLGLCQRPGLGQHFAFFCPTWPVLIRYKAGLGGLETKPGSHPSLVTYTCRYLPSPSSVCLLARHGSLLLPYGHLYWC